MSIFSGFETIRHDRASSGHLINSTENVAEDRDINTETMEMKKKFKKPKWISSGSHKKGEKNKKCNTSSFYI